jgi:carboxyl-terminal processing protease
MSIEEHFDRRTIVLSALLSFFLIMVCGGIALYVLSTPDIEKTNSLSRAAALIEYYYDEEINWNRAFSNARDSMFGLLDRYSGYIEPRAFSQMEEELSGGYSGIGVTVTKCANGLDIISVRESGPAAQAGILSGDEIIKVDTTDLANLDIEKASILLRGSEGSKLELKIFRPVISDTLSVTVTRGRVDLLHVPFAGYTNDSLIYIRLLDFEAGASNDLQNAIDSLMNKPGAKPRGLILDLRGNPGGLLNEAISTANLFLSPGQLIVGTASRSKWDEEQYYSTYKDITNGLPIAVLVDRGSASSAEITAGSLHQLGRAILVGDTTFGKGLVQGYSRNSDGSGIRLTISRYYLAGNLFLNRLDSLGADSGNGLIPDVYFVYPQLSEFIADLETSLLLPTFAYEHQDELISGKQFLGPETSWVIQFALYAHNHEFMYSSIHTNQLLEMLEYAKGEKQSPQLIEEFELLLQSFRRDDLSEFNRYQDYIEIRLKQLAYERKYGSYKAYSEVLIKQRPDIKFVAEQLIRRKS